MSRKHTITAAIAIFAFSAVGYGVHRAGTVQPSVEGPVQESVSTSSEPAIESQVRSEISKNSSQAVSRDSDFQVRAPASEVRPLPSPKFIFPKSPDAESEADENNGASPAATIESINEALFFKVKYGAAIATLSQSGALGSFKGGNISTQLFAIEAGFVCEDFKAAMEFKRYGFSYAKDSTSATTDQTMQDLALSGEYKKIAIGLRSKSAPIFFAPTASTLVASNLVSYSAFAGYRFDFGAKSSSDRALQFSLAPEAEYVFAGSGTAGALSVSEASGYSARLRVKVSKPLIVGSQARLAFGFEASMGYEHVDFNGTLLGASGKVVRDYNEGQALLTLTLEY